MKERVLVVDDELGPRESFRMLLKDRFEVDLAADGEQGIARAQENSYSVVFLDLRMPGLDGIRTLCELRKLRPQMPVVVVTAYATMETAAQALEMGAVDCLIKPFNRRDVERLIQKALQPAAGGI